VDELAGRRSVLSTTEAEALADASLAVRVLRAGRIEMSGCDSIRDLL
jgi:hypothetical protein